MFKHLITLLLAHGAHTQTSAAAALGYKTQSSFYSAIQNKDIKLGVLYSICKLCGCDIIITNNKDFTLSIAQYIKDNTPK